MEKHIFDDGSYIFTLVFKFIWSSDLILFLEKEMWSYVAQQEAKQNFLCNFLEWERLFFPFLSAFSSPSTRMIFLKLVPLEVFLIVNLQDA